MSEDKLDHPIAEDVILKTIFAAAGSSLRDSVTNPEQAAIIRRSVKSLMLFCAAADEYMTWDVREYFIDALQEAYTIGAFSYATEFAKELMSKNASLGGRKGGHTRREAAKNSWGLEAKRLMIEIRHKFPEIADADVIRRTLSRWANANAKPPGEKSLANFLKGLEKDGVVTKRRRATK